MLDLVLLTSNHMLRLTNENENEASFSFSSRTITCNFYRNMVYLFAEHLQALTPFAMPTQILAYSKCAKPKSLSNAFIAP